MRVSGLGGGDDFLFGRAGLADGDVVADRAVEQEHVLADIGDLLAQAKRRDTSAMFWPSMLIVPLSGS